ncbi:MAG: esterase/lipase family protein [Solirubrobacterales bacterium]
MRGKKLVSVVVILSFVLTLGIFVNLPQPPAQAAAPRLNSYPIILTGGFGVWGREEMHGFYYWGGLTDLQQKLREAGYPCYTSAVAPTSSYWDRACELYAQIKGTRVDYGAAHAADKGHSRWGRDYSKDSTEYLPDNGYIRGGLYPQWGDVDPATGRINKVHLIGHSMGGPTQRGLIALLEDGNIEEIQYHLDHPGEPPMSPLFEGGKSWVSSCVTISSPHDGTSLNNGLNGVPWIQQVIGGFVALHGGKLGLINYDFKLDQWDLTKGPTESNDSYVKRVWASKCWYTDDLSNTSGTPEGARDFNTWAVAQPDVFYFSWATEATFKEIFTGRQVPEVSMAPIWTLFGFHMGSYTTNAPGKVPIDKSWWQNDGVVNTNSQDGPTLTNGVRDTIVNYNGTPQVGKWNYMGVKSSWDHSDIIGCTTLWSVVGFYKDIAALTGALPN